MKKTLKYKLAGKICVSPQINHILLQSKKSWDEVEGMLRNKGRAPERRTDKSG